MATRRAPEGRGGKDALSEARWLEATVFVGRLPRRVDVHDVYALVSAAGPVARIIPAASTYLFVEYTAPPGADAAVRMLNGQPVGGSRIVVQVSER